MIGIDWSEWDNGRHPGLDPATFFSRFDFVIVRVANENAGPDRYAQGNVDAARRCGKPWGLYAWPIVGWGHDGNRDFARRLVGQWGIGPLGLSADAEHSPRGFASADEVAGFCQGVEDSGAVAPYYCAITELHRSEYLDGLPWWVADYGPNDGNYHDPNEQWPYIPPDRPWQVHQFTSLGWPGGGSLDVNYCENLNWAGGGGAPAPERIKEHDMFIMVNRDSGAHTLYTGLGFQNVDESYSNELAFAGVPRYSVPAGVADSTAIIHTSHRNDLVKQVDDSISDEGGGGGGAPPDLTAVGRGDWAAETNRRLGADQLDIESGAGATFIVQ